MSVVAYQLTTCAAVCRLTCQVCGAECFGATRAVVLAILDAHHCGPARPERLQRVGP